MDILVIGLSIFGVVSVLVLGVMYVFGRLEKYGSTTPEASRDK